MSTLALSSVAALPGNTTYPPEEFSSEDIDTLPPLDLPTTDRPVIVFASNDVNDTTLFLNGLTQNIVILYDLCESLGYKPYLLQHTSAPSEKREFLKRYRTTTAQDMVKFQMNIKLFVEIGMSIDPATRQYLRSTGAKITKLYLGNILNIDVETIQYYPSMFFNHHVVGELDEIWTSPHYHQHVDYAAILNRTDPATSKIVPYVWDPCFLTQYGTKDTLEWIPPPASSSPSASSPSASQTQDIVIMDPNISFQKCTFYSLLLAEAYARSHPEWKGKVHIINGDRLNICSYAHNILLPALTLYQQGRIHLYGRQRIHEILATHRSACFITHQWNNEYNYMTLELLYCHYPILHNSTAWSPYGYYYSIDDWENAIQTLHRALTSHQENLAMYRVHAARLIAQHSIYDPTIRRRWKAILDS